MIRKTRTLHPTYGKTHADPYYNYNYEYGGSKTLFCKRQNICTGEWDRANDKLFPSRTRNIGDLNGPLGFESFWSTQRRRPQFNTCSHAKVETVCLAVTGILAHYNKKYGGAYDLRSAGLLQRYRVKPVSYELEPIKRHPALDTSGFSARAWHTMQPEFEGNVEMLNFLYELKDFKSIMKFMNRYALRDLVDIIKSNVRRLKRRRAYKGQSFIDPTIPAAELYLTHQFVLKPLISDLVSIGDQLKCMVEEAQQQFALEGLAGNTRHYTEIITSSSEPSDVDKRYYRSGVLNSTTATATLSYTYGYSNREPLDAIMRYWGLQGSAEVLWNALPFTFLVDYVLNVGQTLSMMEHDPNVKLNVAQYCESLLTEHSIGKFLGTAPRWSPCLVDGQVPPDRDTLISGSKATFYSRELRDPNWGPVSPQLKLPNFRQSLNCAALLRTIL